MNYELENKLTWLDERAGAGDYIGLKIGLGLDGDHLNPLLEVLCKRICAAVRYRTWQELARYVEVSDSLIHGFVEQTRYIYGDSLREYFNSKVRSYFGLPFRGSDLPIYNRFNGLVDSNTCSHISDVDDLVQCLWQKDMSPDIPFSILGKWKSFQADICLLKYEKRAFAQWRLETALCEMNVLCESENHED